MAIVASALVAAGLASFLGVKEKIFPYQVQSFRAYQIANAGVEFAARYCTDHGGDLATCANKTNIAFGGGRFTTNYLTATDALTSTGVYSGVSRVITVTNFRLYVNSSGVKFENPAELASFSPKATDPGLINVDTAKKVISLGQMIPAQGQFGAIWYGGSNQGGNCEAGRCDFGGGFRAFFVFTFSQDSKGEGFTFAIVNGGDNDANSVGGDSAMAELMAYGGDSRIYNAADGQYSTAHGYISQFLDARSTRGLFPPKIGIEFDTYQNSTCAICPSTDYSSPNDHTRCDPTGASSNDHVAYLFWGDEIRLSCKETQTFYGRQGSTSYPSNAVVFPASGSPSDLYMAITPGTTGIPDPVWLPDKDAIVPDGSVVWTHRSWLPRTKFSVGDLVLPAPDSYPNGYYYQCRATRTNRKTGDEQPGWRTDTALFPDGNVTWQRAGSIPFLGRSESYDDNQHGAGSGTNPQNLGANNCSGGSFCGNAFKIGSPYAFRVEVTRNSKPNINGTYSYKITSWVKACGGTDNTCPAYQGGKFDNTLVNFTDDKDPPYLDRTVELTSVYHNKFSKFLFGWTTAVGDTTQDVTIGRFSLDFKP